MPDPRLKGVILAGGKGPGCTAHPVTNKHLLPIYDRPMVTYAIEALVERACRSSCSSPAGRTRASFCACSGAARNTASTGSRTPIRRARAASRRRSGSAEHFVAGDRVVVMLADNVLERWIRLPVEHFLAQESGARILLSRVGDPHLRHLGVPELSDGRVSARREARGAGESDLAVIGVYISRPGIFDVFPTLEPSGRGELRDHRREPGVIDQGKRVESTSSTASGRTPASGRTCSRPTASCSTPASRSIDGEVVDSELEGRVSVARARARSAAGCRGLWRSARARC